MSACVALLELPDPLLLHTLALLRRQCRGEGWRSTVPLVSRRFRQLAGDPQLVLSMSVSLLGPLTAERTASFAAWLGRHGASVQRLSLAVGNSSDLSAGIATAELEQQLAAALAAGCATGGVRHLVLRLFVRCSQLLFHNLSAPLSPLRSLEIVTPYSLWLHGSLAGMSQLEQLSARLHRLDELPAVFSVSEAVLPASLTKLDLYGRFNGDHLPRSRASLSNLQRLSIAAHFRSSLDGKALQRLPPNLSRLELKGCHSLPPAATLAALPGLRELSLPNCFSSRHWQLFGRFDDPEAPLEEMLRAEMPQLTALIIMLPFVQLGRPPATLALMPSLRRLQLDSRELRSQAEPPADLGLPAGQWLRSLESLSLRADFVAASLGALQARAASPTCT